MEEYKTMQKEVLKRLDDMMRKDRKALLVGDFNCKGVNWKEMEESGNAGSWSEEMLQLVMENTLDQWVEEFTRLRGEDEPSILDLVFTIKPELQPIIKYLSPMGKSDHVLMEVELQEGALVRKVRIGKKGL